LRHSLKEVFFSEEKKQKTFATLGVDSRGLFIVPS